MVAAIHLHQLSGKKTLLVDMDQELVGMVGADKLVAVGRGFAETSAGDKQQVRLADALLEFRVGAIAKLPGIDAALIVDRVLPAEGRCGRDAVAPG